MLNSVYVLYSSGYSSRRRGTWDGSRLSTLATRGFEPHWRPLPAKLPSFGGYSLETSPHLMLNSGPPTRRYIWSPVSLTTRLAVNPYLPDACTRCDLSERSGVPIHPPTLLATGWPLPAKLPSLGGYSLETLPIGNGVTSAGVVLPFLFSSMPCRAVYRLTP